MKSKRKISKGTIPKILSYIGKYRILFALSLLMGAVSVCLTLYIPLLVGKAIDLIIGKDAVDFGKMTEILLLGIVCVIVATLSQWIMGVINNRITLPIRSKLNIINIIFV